MLTSPCWPRLTTWPFGVGCAPDSGLQEVLAQERDLLRRREHIEYLFQAVNAARYQRQDLIRAIEVTSKTRLICYVSEVGMVTRDGVVPIMDLLHHIPIGTPIDLLLNTPGGDVDSAEKIVRILRRRVGSGIQLRVVVPDYAKSAGTLIALGADVIVMSDSSELGPSVSLAPSAHLRGWVSEADRQNWALVLNVWVS